jgi:protein-tyrosine-phosphatase
MAAAFLAHHGGSDVIVRSAGTAPANTINPVVVDVMAEKGIDLLASGATPKVLEADIVQQSDYVITMGCGDACPFFPGVHYLDWALDDPAGQDSDFVRKVRDDIETRVLDLLVEIRSK